MEVSVQVNIFGFLATRELSAADPRRVSGNYGFQDAQEALRWVQRNIALFGGDPSKVRSAYFAGAESCHPLATRLLQLANFLGLLTRHLYVLSCVITALPL